MVLRWRRRGRAGGCQIKIKIFDILIGGVAQLGEHLPCKQGVKSSNLSISIWFSIIEIMIESRMSNNWKSVWQANEMMI